MFHLEKSIQTAEPVITSNRTLRSSANNLFEVS